MKKYVLLLSIGPVQGFIASARNSRDLWSGSWLLSEIAKAVAKMLDETGAILIFPSMADNDKHLLQPNSEFSVGNKIQVIVKANNVQDVKKLAEQADETAQQRFRDEAQKAYNKLNSNNVLRKNIWDAQIKDKDYVEVQSAWAVIDPSQSDEQGYQLASDKAMQLLSARKVTREFEASPAKNAYDSDYMIPKSSLDGARETVLPQKRSLAFKTQMQLRLSDSEQLDTVGVVKRLGGDPEQFTPFTRIAADGWIGTLSDDECEKINKIYEKLVENRVATRVRGNKNNGKSIYARLPYDANFLYPYRLDAEISRIKRILTVEGDPELTQAYEQLKDLKKCLTPIWRTKGQPCSYGVLLLADGDKMGVLLDSAKTLKQHQEITQALSKFAGTVPQTMRDYQGHTIYAGGDDVLGFVPLYQAYECAEALSKSFYENLKCIADTLGAATPTLSVGLAIAHITTPLGQIRELAKRAEGIAKGDSQPENMQRNALGISLSVRSGSISDLRLRWKDEEALDQFKAWQAAYGQDRQDRALPSRIAYDVRDIYLRTDFPNITTTENEETLVKANIKDIRQAEFNRMLKKARTSGGHKIPQEIQNQLNSRLEALNNLELLATELFIARWLAMKIQQDKD